MMRQINKPIYNTKTIVEECSKSIKDKLKRDKYNSCAEFICNQSTYYDNLATSKSLYKIISHDNVNSILTKSDMENLYTNKFAKHDSVRSKYYDKIKASSSDVCPICGINVVSNLDHYLAKSFYPTYAVTPFNLIPICRDCNFHKTTSKFTDLISSPFHPYYDSIDNEEWLIATLTIVNNQMVAQYSVNPKLHSSNINLYLRLCNHFKMYKLGKAYSIRSSSEIAENHNFWKQNYISWGEKKFLCYLKQQLKSCEEYQKNTWKTALLRALINNSIILK